MQQLLEINSPDSIYVGLLVINFNVMRRFKELDLSDVVKREHEPLSIVSAVSDSFLEQGCPIDCSRTYGEIEAISEKDTDSLVGVKSLSLEPISSESQPSENDY